VNVEFTDRSLPQVLSCSTSSGPSAPHGAGLSGSRAVLEADSKAGARVEAPGLRFSSWKKLSTTWLPRPDSSIQPAPHCRGRDDELLTASQTRPDSGSMARTGQAPAHSGWSANPRHSVQSQGFTR
jgi:hypothetical protein